MLKGNKGEWSEAYTFFKLLGDGVLYGADSELNKIPDVFYSVIKIIRSQKEGIEYNRNEKIEILDLQNNLLMTKPISEMNMVADEILTYTVNSKTTTFEIPSITSVLEEMSITTLKAPNTDKRDITIKIHDALLGSEPTLGFSIKSQLGSPATLLNASKATNVTYKLKTPLSTTDIEKLEDTPTLSAQLAEIYRYNNSLEYDSFDHPKFKRNLLMIDYGLLEIYADLLKVYFLKKDNYGNAMDSKISTLITGVANNDPLNIEQDCFAFYSYKIKELLTNIALGFTPATIWDGSYDATGGYIIIKDDGEIVCYHIYNRNEFRNYLFNNCKLDTPSRTKHGFGTFYNENGETYIKLNAQIRAIK